MKIVKHIHQPTNDTALIVDNTFDIITNLSSNVMKDRSELFFKKINKIKYLIKPSYLVEDYVIRLSENDLELSIDFPNLLELDEPLQQLEQQLIYKPSKEYVLTERLTLERVKSIMKPEYGIDHLGVYDVNVELYFKDKDYVLSNDEQLVATVIGFINDSNEQKYKIINRIINNTTIAILSSIISSYLTETNLEISLVGISNRPFKIVTEFDDTDDSYQFIKHIDEYNQTYYEYNRSQEIGQIVFIDNNDNSIRFNHLFDNYFSCFDVISEDYFIPKFTYSGTNLINEPITSVVDIHEVFDLPKVDSTDKLEFVTIIRLQDKLFKMSIIKRTQLHNTYTIVLDENINSSINRLENLYGNVFVKHLIMPFERNCNE